MISGATRGTGGHALGAHLADAAGLNERTELGLSRGLVGTTIREQIVEITDLASHSRAVQPLYHIHADPPPGAAWNESTWQRYWSLTEKEFDLQRAAYSEERHTKGGREHRHRIYNLVRADGTTNAMSHDFQRREKLSRIMEYETGAPLTPGSHNRAVLAALDREGRLDVAAAMREARLDTMERPRAKTSPKQRAQAERTGVDPRVVGVAVLAAWAASDGGAAFVAALREQGLGLAQGTKAAVVIDSAGGIHSLANILGTESKAAGMSRIAAVDVRDRLTGVDLPRHDPLGGPRPSSKGLAEEGMGTEPIPETVAASDAVPAPASAPSPQDDAVSPLDPSHPGESHARSQPDRPRDDVDVQSEPETGPAETVVDDRFGGGSGRERGTGTGQGNRQERVVDGQLRRDASRSRDDRPAAVARPTGAAGAGREQDRDRDRPLGKDARIAGADRSQAGRVRLAERQFHAALASVAPDRLARLRALADRLNPAVAARLDVGRTRIDERRIEQALDALPPDRLAAIVRRADRLDPVAAALATSRERVTAVFAQEPWPDPASRNRREVANLAKDLVDASVKHAVAVSAEAEAHRRQAADRIGILDRLARVFGRETDAILAERTAAAEAERLRIDADTQSGSHGRRLDQADTDASNTVRTRERERESWLESREVVGVIREAHGNDLVEKAIKEGVPGVRDLAARDLAAARDLLLRQEQIERQAREALQVKLRRQQQAGLRQQPVAPSALPIPGRH